MARNSPDNILSRGSSDVLHKYLIKPSEEALKKASEMNGLTDRDKTDFCYVVWPYNQKHLWKTDGML